MYMVVFFMEEILLHHYILTKLENREVIFVTKTSLVAQTVKHLPKMREIRIQSLGQKDPLEKEMATHSSTLAWKIPRTEEPGGLQTMGSQRVGHDWVTSFSLFSLSLLLKDTEIQSKSSDVFLVCIFMKFSVAFKILQPHCFFFFYYFIQSWILDCSLCEDTLPIELYFLYLYNDSSTCLDLSFDFPS